MRIIGLTGGICSGKSTVSRMLRQRGARIVDADQIARQVVKPGEPALEEIARAFGPHVIRPDGSLDRERMASLIFADEKQRLLLNRIVHPRVADEQARAIARIAGEDPGALVVIDAALLIEVGGHRDVEKLIVVYVPLEVQVERLTRRNGISEKEALLRIRSQMPLEEKAGMADFVVDNSGSLNETELQVEAICQALRLSDPAPGNAGDSHPSR